VGRYELWTSQQHINISELSTLVSAVKELSTRYPGKAWTAVLCDNTPKCEIPISRLKSNTKSRIPV
jgi:hypothetical protein